MASEYGKGSEFRFYIQCKVGKLEHRVEEPPRKLSVGGKPRVLIVEDNVINRTVLLRQLKHVGLITDCEFISSTPLTPSGM